jgi:hypothetical protein
LNDGLPKLVETAQLLSSDEILLINRIVLPAVTLGSALEIIIKANQVFPSLFVILRADPALPFSKLICYFKG